MSGQCEQTDPECYSAACEAQLTACTDDLPMGTLTCGELNDCRGMCGQDSTCQNDCYFNATSEAQMLDEAMQECFTSVISSGQCMQSDPMCYNMACQTQVQACLTSGPPPPPPTPGTLSCADAVACTARCNQDMACFNACLNGVSEAEAPALESLLTCGQENMCEDATCIQMSCGDELAACGL